MQSDWFNGIEILQGRWQHGEKVGYYSVEPVRLHFREKQPCTNDTVCNSACSIAHSIICTWLFHGKMQSDWFNGIEILQRRWHHGEKVGYCYPSRLEKTLCKWDIYVLLVTKGLMNT